MTFCKWIKTFRKSDSFYIGTASSAVLCLVCVCSCVRASVCLRVLACTCVGGGKCSVLNVTVLIQYFVSVCVSLV